MKLIGLAGVSVGLTVILFSHLSPAYADRPGTKGRGTIVHADGTMTVIVPSAVYGMRSYVMQFNKQKQQQGGCIRESMSAL